MLSARSVKESVVYISKVQFSSPRSFHTQTEKNPAWMSLWCPDVRPYGSAESDTHKKDILTKKTPTNFRWELENEAEKDERTGEGSDICPSTLYCVCFHVRAGLGCSHLTAPAVIGHTGLSWHHNVLVSVCVGRTGTPLFHSLSFFFLPCKFPSLWNGEVWQLHTAAIVYLPYKRAHTPIHEPL